MNNYKETTLIGSKLSEALENKKNDINSVIWKGRKVEINGKFYQEEKRLVDCSEEELNEHYDHCNSMLYNKSENDPGRYVLLNIIKDQRNRCNAELFLRWLEDKDGSIRISRFSFREALVAFFNKNSNIDAATFPISRVVNSEQCPSEFENIPSSLILEGCLDRLGKFNKKHITLSFIMKQGLWFAPQETKDFVEKDENGNVRDRIEIVRERLKLPDTIQLKTNPRGLSYAQLHAMVHLKSKKYSDLTTDQLTVLRDKILFVLEDDVRKHANQWEQRKSQIVEVMKLKGYTLPADAEE